MEIAKFCSYYWYEYVDPRTKDLPLVESPIIMPSIVVAYLIIVLKLGPEYMKNRKPYSLKTFIRYYNVFQVIVNAYIIARLCSAGLFSMKTSYVPDYSFEPDSVKMAHTFWLTMMVKLIDLVETVTFVLRKKQNQISFLHLYHHVSTLLLMWMFAKYDAIKYCALQIAMNCFVHVIMYTYYYFSSFGDKSPKILESVKPFITITQMVQLVFLILHTLGPYVLDHNLSLIPPSVQMVNLLINFKLFYDFYQKSYKTPKKKAN